VAHPVNWFQIEGKEVPPLQKFYKAVFNWRMTPAPDGSGLVMVAKEEGGRGEPDGIAGHLGASRDGKAGISVYIGVGDIAAHLKKVQDAGGQVAMPPMELSGGMGWIAGFIDPGGNWVGLWQAGKPSAPAPKAAKKKTTARKAAAKAPAAAKKPAAKPVAAKPAAAKKPAAKKPAAKPAAAKSAAAKPAATKPATAPAKKSKR
jgi:predicted enzyme related to lactoylglutathione lyase